MSLITITKGRNGWTASSEFDIDVLTHAQRGSKPAPGRSVLSLDTYKCREGLKCVATVLFRTDDGLSTHALGAGGDYYRTVLDKKARCTETAVRDLHYEALRATNAILAEARAFYELKGGAS